MLRKLEAGTPDTFPRPDFQFIGEAGRTSADSDPAQFAPDAPNSVSAHSPRLGAGMSSRQMTLAILAAAVVAILAFSIYQWNSSVPDASLSQRGMSPGHRMLNLEAGRTLPANAPRIQRADALVTRVSNRFRTSKEKVAELALTTRNMIARKQPEDVLDVLDAALFATDGLAQGSVPPLAPVFAAYAQVRENGGTVAAARSVARSFAQMAAQEAPPPPPDP
ncbi:MAG TPA: hypothetical protein VGD21_07990 [Lysobacter sp.]